MVDNDFLEFLRKKKIEDLSKGDPDAIRRAMASNELMSVFGDTASFFCHVYKEDKKLGELILASFITSILMARAKNNDEALTDLASLTCTARTKMIKLDNFYTSEGKKQY